MRKKQLIIISIIMLSIGIYGANGGATTISGSSELTYTPVKPKTTNLVKECSVAGITPSSKIKTFESSMPTFVKISKLGTVQSKSVVSTLKSERLPTLRTNLTVKEQKSVVPEYFAINQGIILYEEKKYPEATTTFEGILKGMSSSDLLKSYVEYYLAKSYFQNGEYIRAIEWAKRTNDSPYEMKEVISLSYQKLNRNEMSEKYDRELFINGYSSSASTYEKRALQRLSKDSIYYQNVVSVMYEENFSALSTLTTPDLQKISNYFIGISDYKSALAVDNELLKRDNERYIQEQKLYLLYSLKQYVAAEKYGLELLKRESSNSVNYYIGLSNQRQGNLAKATEDIEKLQGGSVEREKTQLLGRYAYLQKNYQVAIPYLIKQSDNSSLEMLIECYEKSGQASLANETKQKIMRAYPTLDLCAYYRFQEYTATKNQKYLQEIIKYNLNSYYYEYALENLGISAPINNYPIEKVGSEYKSLTLQIEALLSMKFYVGANMLLQNSGLESQNIFYFVYLQTQIYNAQEKYASSLNLAIKHFRTIYAYSNFVPLIFPNYYSQEVAAAAKKTDLPPSLIYAIIRQESSFNRGASSPASAYGLMQLTLPTAKGYDTGVTRDKLLTAGYNIDLGSQNLEKLMNRYNGNILKVAAAYNAGPGAVSRWEKENPTLRDSDIPYQETQNYVRKIINNYDKYNRLYYSDTNMVGKYLTLPPVVTSPLVEGSVGK